MKKITSLSVVAGLVITATVFTGCVTSKPNIEKKTDKIGLSNRSKTALEKIQDVRNDIKTIRDASLVNIVQKQDKKNYFITLSTSGGGHRAAAFTAGVMNGLDKIEDDKSSVEKNTAEKNAYDKHIEGNLVKIPKNSILKDLSLISSVSGSALATAYYCYHNVKDQNDKEKVLRDFLNLIAGDEMQKNTKKTIFESSQNAILGLDILPLKADNFMAIDEKEAKKYMINKFFDKNATLGDIYNIKDNTSTRLIIGASNANLQQGFYFIPEEFMMYGRSVEDFKNTPITNALYATMAHPVVAQPAIFVNSYKYSRYLKNIPYFYNDKSTSQRLADFMRHSKIKLVDGGIWDNLGINVLLNWHDEKRRRSNSNDANKATGHLIIVVDSGKLKLYEQDINRFKETSNAIDMLIDSTSAVSVKRIGQQDVQNKKYFENIRSLLDDNSPDAISAKKKIERILAFDLYKNITSKEKKDLLYFKVLIDDLSKNLERYTDEKINKKINKKVNAVIKQNFRNILTSTKLIYISFSDISEIEPALDIGANIDTKMSLTKKEANSLFEIGSILADSKRNEIRTMIKIMPDRKSYAWVFE